MRHHITPFISSTNLNALRKSNDELEATLEEIKAIHRKFNLAILNAALNK